MKVVVVTDVERLHAMRRGWADLADAANAPIHAAPFWAEAWCRHIPRGGLRVSVVEDSAGPVAMMTLHGRVRAGREVLRFIGDDLGSVSAAIVAPGHAAAADALWAELLSEPARILDLRRHRLAPPGLAPLWRVPDAAFSAVVSNVCPVIDRGSTAAEHLAGRGSRLRRVLTRSPKLIAADGLDLDTAIVADVADVERVLPELQTLWDAAETANPRTHFLAGPLRPFTLDVLTRAAEEDRLALALTRIGGRLVGSAFGYRVGHTWSYSGPRFDPEFQRYSPGHLTLQRLVEHVLGRGDGLDLLLGGQDYKWQWSTSSYDVADVLAASTPRGLRAARWGLRGYQWAQLQSYRMRQWPGRQRSE